MARGVNKVILIGNLGDEPLCRTTHSGSSVTNISMVTNEVRRNIDTGEYTEYAEWHRVVMWGKLADIARQYLHKGSQIYVEGKLRTRSFMDKQGQKRSVTEVVADEMQMLGTRASSAASLPQGNPYRGGTTAPNNFQRQGAAGEQGQYGSFGSQEGYYGNAASNMQTSDYAGQFGGPIDDVAPLPDEPFADNFSAKPRDKNVAEEREPVVRESLNDEIPF